jgi:hypothetical protein
LADQLSWGLITPEEALGASDMLLGQLTSTVLRTKSRAYINTETPLELMRLRLIEALAGLVTRFSP